MDYQVEWQASVYGADDYSILISAEVKTDDAIIGTATGFLIRASHMVDCGETDIHGYFDQHSNDLSELSASVFDMGEKFYDEYADRDVLYISYVEVEEAYRGHKIGHAAVREAIQIFGANCLVAVLPCPPNKLIFDDRLATQKLRKYWGGDGI